jgi:hypothetical protein
MTLVEIPGSPAICPGDKRLLSKHTNKTRPARDVGGDQTIVNLC